MSAIIPFLCNYYEEGVGTGDVGRVEEFIAPGYEEVFDGKRYPVGIERAKALVLVGRMADTRVSHPF